MNNLHASEKATAGLLRANIVGRGVGGGMWELEGERRDRKGEGKESRGTCSGDGGRGSCPKCRDAEAQGAWFITLPAASNVRSYTLGQILTWGKFLPMWVSLQHPLPLK